MIDMNKSVMYQNWHKFWTSKVLHGDTTVSSAVNLPKEPASASNVTQPTRTVTK
jgi:hypothetical protein